MSRSLEPDREAALDRKAANDAGPVRLSAEYLAMVLEVEGAPENRTGVDKTWVETALRRYRDHYARVREKP